MQPYHGNLVLRKYRQSSLDANTKLCSSVPFVGLAQSSSNTTHGTRWRPIRVLTDRVGGTGASRSPKLNWLFVAGKTRSSFALYGVREKAEEAGPEEYRDASADSMIEDAGLDIVMADMLTF